MRCVVCERAVEEDQADYIEVGIGRECVRCRDRWHCMTNWQIHHLERDDLYDGWRADYDDPRGVYQRRLAAWDKERLEVTV